MHADNKGYLNSEFVDSSPLCYVTSYSGRRKMKGTRFVHMSVYLQILYHSFAYYCLDKCRPLEVFKILSYSYMSRCATFYRLSLAFKIQAC
jgi:hypothetical protein